MPQPGRDGQAILGQLWDHRWFRAHTAFSLLLAVTRGAWGEGKGRDVYCELGLVWGEPKCLQDHF